MVALPSFSSSCLLTNAWYSETEKYAHVTFFFNGGVEKQFALEERFMIPSPKVCAVPPCYVSATMFSPRVFCGVPADHSISISVLLTRVSFYQVATYDLKPEMSVQAVADKVASVVQSKEYDFVMCNFAPPDMVRFVPFPATTPRMCFSASTIPVYPPFLFFAYCLLVC